MKYPHVYYQMKKIAEFWRNNLDRTQDKERGEMIIAECEFRCDAIEIEHMEDEFDGDIEDFHDMDMGMFGMEFDEESLEDFEEVL